MSTYHLTVQLHPPSSPSRPYKLLLFQSLEQTFTSILKFLRLKPVPSLYIFLLNGFPLVNEDDFYNQIANFLEAEETTPIPISIRKKKEIIKKLTNRKFDQKKNLIFSTKEEKENGEEQNEEQEENDPDSKEEETKSDNFEKNELNEKMHKGAEVFCCFCNESSLSEEFLNFLGPVYGPFKGNNKSIFLHELCALWSPAIFLNEKGKLKNISKEYARGRKMYCSYCGERGATLGCEVKECKKNWHVKCVVKDEVEAELDVERFTARCGEHLKKEPQYENLFCQG